MLPGQTFAGFLPVRPREVRITFDDFVRRVRFWLNCLRCCPRKPPLPISSLEMPALATHSALSTHPTLSICSKVLNEGSESCLWNGTLTKHGPKDTIGGLRPKDGFPIAGAAYGATGGAFGTDCKVNMDVDVNVDVDLPKAPTSGSAAPLWDSILSSPDKPVSNEEHLAGSTKSENPPFPENDSKLSKSSKTVSVKPKPWMPLVLTSQRGDLGDNSTFRNMPVHLTYVHNNIGFKILPPKSWDSMESALWSNWGISADKVGVVSINQQDRLNAKQQKANLLYGEILAPGVRVLLNNCRWALNNRSCTTEAEDIFLLDLGCGVGKVVLQAFAEGWVRRAIGVEIAQSRSYIGRTAVKRFATWLQTHTPVSCLWGEEKIVLKESNPNQHDSSIYGAKFYPGLEMEKGRELEMRHGNLLEVEDALWTQADIILLAVDIPKECKPKLGAKLKLMRLNSIFISFQCLSAVYQNLYTEGFDPIFDRLPVQTSWNHAAQFYIYRRITPKKRDDFVFV